MSLFPGDYSTFRNEFLRTVGSPWDAVFHFPWKDGSGWSALFAGNRTWAVVMSSTVGPDSARYGKRISPVYHLVWGSRPVRMWRLDPLTAQVPMTVREAFPRALSRPRPWYLRLV